jgi:photosystem II stability/assembly factor-like uncharacterized protein
MGGMFKSTDNGLNWSLVSSTSSLSFSRLFETEGKLYAGTFLGGLYVSTDSGVSWIHANGIPNGFRLSALAAIPYLSGTKILAGFESGSNLYISVNDTTWEIFGSPELGRVCCLNQDDQYIFALSPQDVFYSTDNGDSWKSIGSGLPPASYCSFAAYPDSSGGRYLFAGSDNNLINRSSDMGTHWTNVSNERAYDLALLTGESGVNLFCANYWGVLCSTDNGASWINKSNGIVSYIETLFAEGSGVTARIYAGGQQGKLYYSTNYGDNWNQLTPVSGTIISLLVFGDTIFAGTYENLFFSTDHGSSWVYDHNGLPSTAINSLLLIPRGVENQIAAGTGYQGVFVSTTGTSWTPVNDGLPPQCEVLSLLLKDSSVFAGTGNGVWKRPLYQIGVPVELISFTADVEKNGITLNWTTASELNNKGFEIEKKFNDVFKVIGYVAGNGTTSMIHTYTFSYPYDGSIKQTFRLKQVDYDGTFEYSKEIEVTFYFTPDYTLEQNYPNPFNPTTTITYSIPEAARVKLIVYDALGRETALLVDEDRAAGTYSVEFNASELTSGIYFYSLESAGAVISKKLILLR